MTRQKMWPIKFTALLVLLLLQTASAAGEESVFKDTARVRVNLVKVMQLAEELQRTPLVDKTFVGEMIADVFSECTKYRDSFEKASSLEIGYVFSRTGAMHYGVLPMPFAIATEDVDVQFSDRPGQTTLDGAPAELVGQYIAASLEAESEDGTEPFESDVRPYLKKQAGKVVAANDAALFQAIIRPSGFLRYAAIEVYVKQAEAYLLTDAQERDGETVGTSDYRKFGIHVLSNLLRTVTKDIDEVELGCRQLDSGYCTELIITAEGNSALKTYFAKLQNIRNRSVAWLHPDHDSFFSVCLPLPDMVTERLKQLNAANQDLTTLAGIPQTLSNALTRWEEELAESKQIECLRQTIPSEYGRTHVIVIPGRDNFDLTESAIHLVSGEDTSDYLQPYVTTVGNYAVHEVTAAAYIVGITFPGLWTLSEEDVAYVIPTPECLMLISGHPNDCLDIAEELIARDFEPPPEVVRYARVAIGGEFSESTSRSLLSTTAQGEAAITFQTEDGPVTIKPQGNGNGNAPVEHFEPDKAASAPAQLKPKVGTTSSEQLKKITVPGFHIALLVNDDQINLRTTFPKDGEAVMITFVSRLLGAVEFIAENFL